MKSYIEPMSAADALDVLRVFCEPFGDLSYSYNNDEDAVLHGPDGDKVLKTPDEVIAVMGDDATREIAEHKRFRERAVRELMVPVLPEWESIYNGRTGETFILDSNCEGKLYGFYCTETPLATLVDEGEDGIPYDAALYARRQELHRPQGTHRPARRVPPAQLGSRRGRHDGVRISQTRGARGRHRRARLDRAPE